MTGVLGPLEVVLLEPEPLELLLELLEPLEPLPLDPLPLPVVLPLLPVCWVPLFPVRLAGVDCATELETPAAVTCAAAALQ